MIALCTIVKDESEIIQRMLESLEGFVDAYYILDTGSSDNTVEIIEEWLETHEGKVGKSTFKGFATSRNEAIAMVPKKYDYLLIMDADEVLETRNDLSLVMAQKKDMYAVYVRDENNIASLGARIIKHDPKIKYEREIHNQITGAVTMDVIPYKLMLINHVHDGVRAYDKEKLQNDVKKLSKGDTIDDFYKAQTLYAMGSRMEASVYYKRVIDLSDAESHVYFSNYMLGRIKFDAGFFEASFLFFMDAYDIRKAVEPLFYMIRTARLIGHDKLAVRLIGGAKPAIMTSFIDLNIREFLLQKEFADMMVDLDAKIAKEKYEELLEKEIPTNIRAEIEKSVVSLA